MDKKKMVALISVALLIGIGLGYVVGSIARLRENKMWHFVTRFTLCPDLYPGREYEISRSFFIQGEQWRIIWDGGGHFHTYSTPTIVVRDENENMIDVFCVDLGKGIYYIHQGKGNYTIRQNGVQSPINYTIESYH